MKIAVIGAGISGLTCAFYINKFRPDWEVTLYEKEENLGGKMQTHTKDGFLFEIGTNGFLSNKPDTLDLIKDAGAEAMLQKSSDEARKRFVYTDALHQMPESPKAFLQTKLLSFPAKLRVAMEYFTSPKKDDAEESLESFGNRRLGKEFTSVFLDAMSAGIFGSTPQKLSVNAAFPLVVNLEKEYGGLFKGMIAKKKKEAGPGGVLTSFNHGVGEFVEHLKNTLKAKIHTYSDIQKIEKTLMGYTVHSKAHSENFDKVVLSTPSYAAATMLEGIDADLSRALQTIDYTPMSVVGFGYKNLSHPLDGFGLLTTASANKQILGVLWDSSIFTNRAPEDQKSVRVMIGGQRQPDLAMKSEEELIEIAKVGIKETMGVEAEPDTVFVQKWEKAIPSYEVGHLEKTKKIFELLKNHDNLYLNGNAYFGVGLNDCTKNAKACAKAVCEVES